MTDDPTSIDPEKPEEAATIPYRRCPRHPGAVSTGNCPACLREAAEAGEEGTP